MNKHTARRASAAFQPIAIAAAMLLGTSPPAQAQYYDYEGSVFTWPTDLVPTIDIFSAALDLRPNSLTVGAGAAGSFSVWAGADMQAAAIYLGHDGNGSGTMVVQGQTEGTPISALVRLSGTDNRLGIGEWGIGTLTVSGGAIVDATLDAAGCAAASCRSFVGNGAGSTGTLTITGAGSEVRTLRNFTVGQTSVFTDPPNGFVFGTPGGTTNAYVNVLDGGTLRTEGATVANNNRSPDGNGSEQANGTVVINGAGSQWIVTRNSVDNTAALMSLGIGSGADALVTVSGGGKLQIDGTGSSGPNDGINIGSNGKGRLVVTGAGSQVLTSGVNHFINVGANNSLGDGTFEILAGATASTLYLNIGRNGGTATLLIDGAGSTLTQSGVGVDQSPSANGGAFAHIGRNNGGGTGTGSVTVSNGGQWILNDGGGDSRTAQSGPGIAIGRGADSSGTLTITGAGSRVEITASSLGLAPGAADNYNPFVAVGYDNPSTTSGTLMISDGGKLILNGNAVSTVADGRATTLNIGGRTGTAATGTATVTGAGSEIVLNGYDSLINVGREAGSNGSLNVLDGAKVSGISLVAGVGGTGTVNIDNATVEMTGYRTDAAQVGAGVTIGRVSGGNGTLNMSNGAQLLITPSVLAGGMSVGGDQFGAGGTGTVTMSGGSSIVIGGTMAGSSMSIGHNGTGTATLDNSSITNEVGNVYVAREAGSIGVLALTNNSTVTADFVGVGVSAKYDGVAQANGGTGVLVLNNSTLRAAGFELGAGSVLTGDGGTIEIVPSSGDVVIGGTIAPGNSPGRLRIRCNIIMLPGSRIVLEVQGTGDFYEIDELIIDGTASFDLASAQIEFSFLGSTDPNQFAAIGGMNLDNFFRSEVGATTTGLSAAFAPGQTWSSVVNTAAITAVSEDAAFSNIQISYTSDGNMSVVAVPEPSTWGLMFAGLAAVGGWARRRKAQAAAQA